MGSGSEPEDAGEELAINEKPKWMEFCKICVERAAPRDTNSLCGKAFEMTCNDMKRLCSQQLSKWVDNGTEDEMIVDMLMVYLLPNLRHDVLRDLKGPTGLRMTLWYKVRSVIYATLLALSRPTWVATKSSSDALQMQLDPIIRPIVSQVVDVLSTIERKLSSLLFDRIDASLSEHITPVLQPIINAFQKPLKDGIKHGRDLFVAKVNIDDLQQSNETLDAIPRTPENVKGFKTASAGLVEPLKDVTFEGNQLDIEKLRMDAEAALLQLLDSAVYTFEVRLEEGCTRDQQLKDKILEDYDQDAVPSERDVVKKTLHKTFVIGFKKLIAPITDMAVDEINKEIPNNMQQFLSAGQILDQFIERVVGDRVDRMIAAAFPSP
jgi:hypothetical protein